MATIMTMTDIMMSTTSSKSSRKGGSGHDQSHHDGEHGHRHAQFRRASAGEKLQRFPARFRHCCRFCHSSLSPVPFLLATTQVIGRS